MKIIVVLMRIALFACLGFMVGSMVSEFLIDQYKSSGGIVLASQLVGYKYLPHVATVVGGSLPLVVEYLRYKK